MKSLFDNFVSMIIYVFIVFTIAGFSLAEMQIVQARHVHTAVINQIQSSYYTVDVSAINDRLHDTFNDNWNVTATQISAVNDRRDYLVTLNYEVELPVFNMTKTGTIQGYAR